MMLILTCSKYALKVQTLYLGQLPILTILIKRLQRRMQRLLRATCQGSKQACSICRYHPVTSSGRKPSNQQCLHATILAEVCKYVDTHSTHTLSLCLHHRCNSQTQRGPERGLGWGTHLSRGAIYRVDEVRDVLHEVSLLHLHAMLLQLVHIGPL